LSLGKLLKIPPLTCWYPNQCFA